MCKVKNIRVSVVFPSLLIVVLLIFQTPCLLRVILASSFMHCASSLFLITSLEEFSISCR